MMKRKSGDMTETMSSQAFGTISTDATAEPELVWTDKTHLIFGMSHTQAVMDGLTDEQRNRINILNIRVDREQFYSTALKSQTPDMKTFMGAEHVFSMIGGNFHNVFGLIEHPTRFDFTYPDIEELHTEERVLVHYGMLREYFIENMGQVLNALKVLTAKIAFPIHHISSPPPSFSEAPILANPKSFAPLLHLGIAPPHLRLKLYRLHTDIIRDHCQTIGVKFVEVPPNTTDERGFLLPHLCANDPTHANAAYGAIVLNQVFELTQ
jgi:hypothetical protein